MKNHRNPPPNRPATSSSPTAAISSQAALRSPRNKAGVGGATANLGFTHGCVEIASSLDAVAHRIFQAVHDERPERQARENARGVDAAGLCGFMLCFYRTLDSSNIKHAQIA